METTDTLQQGKWEAASEDSQRQQQINKKGSPVVNDFLVASRRGFTAQVLEALKEGGSAAANTTDRHGRNCLQLAAIHGHFDTVQSILQARLVNIDAVNKRGLTALHDACTEGHIKISLLLLAMGASVTAQTKDGWTCLMSACSSGNLQLAKILVAAGCDIDVHTKLGLTALHIAAWKGHVNVVEMLLHEGCNPQAQSQNGKTALQLAQDENQHQCTTVLTAAISKSAEDPVYRISSLEGQLKLYQHKLSESLRSYEAMLTNQQLKSEERFAKLQKEHQDEMTKAQQRIEELKKNIEGEKGVLTGQISMLKRSSLESNPPALKPKSPSKVRRRMKKGASSNSNSELINALTSPPNHKSVMEDDADDHLNRRDRLKSASYDNITIDNEEKSGGNILPKTPQLSPGNIKRKSEKKTRRESADRITITALVAESLVNPGSMSAIRKELKSDSFTPKIQRKFPQKSSGTQSTLPSVSPKGSDTEGNGKPILNRDIFDKKNSSSNLLDTKF